MARWQAATERFGMGWSQERACGTGAVCILKSSLWLQGGAEKEWVTWQCPPGTESWTEWRYVWGWTDRSCWWARYRVWERKIQDDSQVSRLSNSVEGGTIYSTPGKQIMLFNSWPFSTNLKTEGPSWNQGCRIRDEKQFQ